MDIIKIENIESKIITIREQKVILDREIATATPRNDVLLDNDLQTKAKQQALIQYNIVIAKKYNETISSKTVIARRNDAAIYSKYKEIATATPRNDVDKKTNESETTIELNFAIINYPKWDLKFKHTVKKGTK